MKRTFQPQFMTIQISQYLQEWVSLWVRANKSRKILLFTLTVRENRSETRSPSSSFELSEPCWLFCVFVWIQSGNPADVLKLVKRFERLQQKFGWGIDLPMFQKLFQYDDEQARRLFVLWDTDQNGAWVHAFKKNVFLFLPGPRILLQTINFPIMIMEVACHELSALIFNQIFFFFSSFTHNRQNRCVGNLWRSHSLLQIHLCQQDERILWFVRLWRRPFHDSRRVYDFAENVLVGAEQNVRHGRTGCESAGAVVARSLSQDWYAEQEKSVWMSEIICCVL